MKIWFKTVLFIFLVLKFFCIFGPRVIFGPLVFHLFSPLDSVYRPARLMPLHCKICLQTFLMLLQYLNMRPGQLRLGARALQSYIPFGIKQKVFDTFVPNM